MTCGRYKCGCAPRSAPFTCKCREPKEKKGPPDYFTVKKCPKCKSPLSREARPGAGTSVLERVVDAEDLASKVIANSPVPALRGQRKLFK